MGSASPPLAGPPKSIDPRHHTHCQDGIEPTSQTDPSSPHADENGQSDAIAAMESCVRVIRNWMHENRLLMNETKTEFLLIGTK